MKIGLITTLSTNIGDDFIREGIVYICRTLKPDVEFEMVNKHAPYTVYPAWHPVAWAGMLPKKKNSVASLLSKLTARARLSKFEDCDAIIQCGAPVYWYGCHTAEWAQVLWKGVAARLAKKIPVLNVAAGSCYPWEDIPEKLSDQKDIEYIRFIHGICRKTFVRDTKSHEILSGLGLDNELLPCTAFLAALPYRHMERTNEFVFLNFMPGSSHYDFNQGISADAWSQTMKGFIDKARGSHPLAFICHNEKEYHEARKLAPDVQAFWPKSVSDYFTLAARGRVGIFNRMHASVGFAGLGIPSIAIGADTRMLMVRQIGLRTAYAKEVDADYLFETLLQLLKERENERIRLDNLQQQTFDTYLDRMGKLLQV